MTARKRPRERPPLISEQLDELALAYVGRFATTRAKLASYLQRKIRERGWTGHRPPDVPAVVERLASLGYVDDAAYALSKSRALTGRGFGVRRVRQSLRAAGIDEQDAQPATEQAEQEAVEAAIRFARRKRLGPFGDGGGDRAAVERSLAAMVRAGHSFRLSKAILSMKPGSEVDVESLGESR